MDNCPTKGQQSYNYITIDGIEYKDPTVYRTETLRIVLDKNFFRTVQYNALN